VTSAGVYGENQVEWARWLKTTVGLHADGSRYSVTNRVDPRNGGTETAGIISPKGSATFGPWHSTELYVNAGAGFHSNSALGTTLKYDGDGDPVSPVTPLVRGRGAEAGVRTVTVPHLQSTVSLCLNAT
jgi:outer membrane receptor protein involved in Fe transport